MPTYSYSNYAAQPTVAERLAMARLHLGELNDLVKPGVGKDGAYRNSFDLVQRIGKLNEEIRRMEDDPRLRRAGGISLARMGYRS